jgi:hypothetical protein
VELVRREQPSPEAFRLGIQFDPLTRGGFDEQVDRGIGGLKLLDPPREEQYDVERTLERGSWIQQ